MSPTDNQLAYNDVAIATAVGVIGILCGVVFVCILVLRIKRQVNIRLNSSLIVNVFSELNLVLKSVWILKIIQHMVFHWVLHARQKIIQHMGPCLVPHATFRHHQLVLRSPCMKLFTNTHTVTGFNDVHAHICSRL